MSQTDFSQPHSVLVRSEQIRTHLLARIWNGLLAVVALAGTFSVLRALYTGWLPIYSLQLGLIVVFLVATACRKRMTLEWRATFLLGFFTVVGVSAVLVFGLIGAGLWWLVLGTMLANVFFSGPVRLVYGSLALGLIALTGAGFITGVLTLPFDANVYVRAPSTWIAMVFGCVMLSLLIFASIATYQRAVVDLLHEVEHNRQQKEVLIKEQEKALAEIRRLQGFIPICAHCKKIRDDQGYWENVEAYVQKHADVQFSHCLCPPCGHELYGDEWDQAMRDLALEPGGKAAATTAG